MALDENIKILIYCYGFIGKNNYGFLSKFFKHVYVYDDVFKKPYDYKNYLDDIKFDLILVSVTNNEIYESIKTKLQGKFDQNIIKFSPIFLNKPSELFLDFIKDKFDLNLIKNFDLEKIVSSLKKLTLDYHNFRKEFDKKAIKIRQEIDDKFDNLDIFQKIYKISEKTTTNQVIFYPGFNTICEINSDARSFYLEDKIDFKALQNRTKPLMLLFGNSSIRHDWLKGIDSGGGCGDYMKKYFKDYFVLSLGVHGASLYEQLCLYNALFYTLKPEIVLSFFGGTDFLYSYLNDQILLKEHSMIYSPQIYETALKELYCSSLPIYLDFYFTEKLVLKPKISDIIKAIFDRLVQFKNTVSSNGGRFIGFLQPFLSKKFYLDDDEKSIVAKNSFDEMVLKNANNFIDSFNEKYKNLEYYHDLNFLIDNKRNRVFYDHYLHCTPYANELIAKFIKKIL